MENEEKKLMNPGLHKKSKPAIRELTLANGISFPSDEELIMLLLGKGSKNNPVDKLASKVISAINNSNPENLIEELCRIEGLGKARSLSIAAALEFGRRRNCFLKAVIDSPCDIIPFVQHYSLTPTENFIAATLNGAHELLSIRVISIGTINKTLIHPREIFAQAVMEHASGIIVCHNHPFGSCSPSQADRDSTKIIQKAAEVLGINFLDHIIITRKSYFSFLEHNLL